MATNGAEFVRTIIWVPYHYGTKLMHDGFMVLAAAASFSSPGPF